MRWVVKVGSGVLASARGGLDHERLTRIAAALARLRERGDQVVLVSSGAVAAGYRHLGFTEPPQDLPRRQAAASVGQFFLVGAYERVWAEHRIPAGLVLLTHQDLEDRHRYLNASHTIETLLRAGAIPLINENDAVAVEEILMGDNDQLAAMVAALVRAERLVLLTDVPGVYDRDPEHPEARLLERLADPERLAEQLVGRRSTLGRGGMRSKLRAAAKAAAFGIPTWIGSGCDPGAVAALGAGQPQGTYVPPRERALDGRRFWIRFVTRPRGRVVVDAGAAEALLQRGSSLLPSGVVAIEGSFYAGDPVQIVDEEGTPVARGLVEYDAEELQRIQGVHSGRIAERLGYVRTPEVVHRDKMVLESHWRHTGGDTAVART